MTQIASLDGYRFEADDDATGWFLKESDAYKKGLKKSGRERFYAKTYDPITVTACQKDPETGGTVCGFVYFPCTDDNGCRPVLNGSW